jgi:uncharacterized protein (DUF2141 family)
MIRKTLLPLLIALAVIIGITGCGRVLEVLGLAKVDVLVISIEPKEGSAGDYLAITFKNNGDTDQTPQYIVVFTADTEVSRTGEHVVYQGASVTIESGKEKSVEVMLSQLDTDDVPAGNYYYGVFIDSNDSIAEDNEANNGLASSSTFTHGGGGPVTETITGTVTIEGTAPYGYLDIGVYSSNASFPLSPAYIAVLPVSGQTVSYSIPNVQPGTYIIAATIDVNNNNYIDTGDFGGSYGDIDPFADAPNAAVISSGTNVFDFSIAELTGSGGATVTVSGELQLTPELMQPDPVDPLVNPPVEVPSATYDVYYGFFAGDIQAWDPPGDVSTADLVVSSTTGLFYDWTNGGSDSYSLEVPEGEFGVILAWIDVNGDSLLNMLDTGTDLLPTEPVGLFPVDMADQGPYSIYFNSGISNADLPFFDITSMGDGGSGIGDIWFDPYYYPYAGALPGVLGWSLHNYSDYQGGYYFAFWMKTNWNVSYYEDRFELGFDDGSGFQRLEIPVEDYRDYQFPLIDDGFFPASGPFVIEIAVYAPGDPNTALEWQQEEFFIYGPSNNSVTGTVNVPAGLPEGTLYIGAADAAYMLEPTDAMPIGDFHSIDQVYYDGTTPLSYSYTLYDLPTGILNVAAFIDVDGSGALEIPFDGPPLEPVGFVGILPDQPSSPPPLILLGPGDVIDFHDFDVITYLSPDDPFEENNSQATAADIAGLAGNPINSLVQLDDDWYWFYVDTGGLDTEIVVDCYFLHAEGDIDIILVDEVGTDLVYGDSTSDDEMLSYRTTMSGNYYIYVYGPDNGQVYDLFWDKYEYVPPPDDPFEENNSPASAADIAGLGGTLIQDLVQNDDDWYFFYVDTGGVDYEIVVECFFNHVEGDIDIELYDEFGGPVVGSYSGSDYESFSYITPMSGFYYVYVYNADVPHGQSYELTWDAYPF